MNCVFDPEPVVSAQIGKSLAIRLTELEHKVTVVAPKPSRPFGFQFEQLSAETSKFELKHLNSYVHPASGILGRFRESISFGIASYKYICANAKDIDLVYMNTWPIFAQFAVALASKRISRPYIVHVQDIYPESLTNKLAGFIGFAANKLLIPMDRFVLRHANKILVISEKMKLYLSESRNLNKDKFEVVLNWQDDTAFQAYQNSWPTGLLTFMYLGNIGPVSNIPFVMNAFVKSCLPNARLIIAGVGSAKETCIKLAEKYPDVDIQFIEVPAGEVPLIQSQAQVMLLPLTKDAGHSSIPSKLPAYMFSSRPVIALAEKGTEIEKTITESGCGWVGDPVDEEWLINCFKMVSDSDSETLVNKGKAGCQYARLHFSKETNLNRLIKSMID